MRFALRIEVRRSVKATCNDGDTGDGKRSKPPEADAAAQTPSFEKAINVGHGRRAPIGKG
jgi:hypothetical protein